MERIALVAGGVALALVALATLFWTPGRWEVVFSVQSSGANEVHIPVVYWMAATLWIVVATLGTRKPWRSIAPLGILIAFFTHVLVLLAALTSLLRQDDAFTTVIYQIYARTFCAGMLAAGIAWSLAAVRPPRSLTSLMAGPVICGSAVLAWSLLFADPFATFAAIVASVIAGRWLYGAGPSRLQVIATIRAMLSRDRIWIAVVFLVALALRLLYLRRVMSMPNYLETGADGPVYDELAWSIAQGYGVRESFTDRFPLLLLGYVWFVSAVYSLVGHSYFAVGALQAVIGAAACALFYDAAKELCGTAIARTAVWFAAISFPLLFAAAAIGHQAIDVFLTVAIVWVLVKTGRPVEWRWWRWCALGVLFGVAIAVRETVTFFLVFVALWIPFLFPRAWSWRAVAPALVVVVTAFVTISPLAIRKVATPEQRLKLRQHFDILYRGEADVVRMRDEIVAPLSDPRGALAQLRAAPAVVIGTLIRAWASNFAVQFFAQPYGGFDLVFLRKGTAYYYALWCYAYGLTAAGLVMVLRRLKTDPHAAGLVLVLGLIASRTLPHLLLESNYRHRVPIEPFLILLAAIAAVGLVESARQLETVSA